MAATDSVRVGVLSLHNSKETKAILNAVSDLGHEPVWLREENSAIQIESGSTRHEPAVDVIANRLLLTNTSHPEEELGLLRSYDELVPTLNRPLPVLTAIHKFSAATTLSRAGVPVPDALLALHPDRLNEGRDRFGPEGVYKTAIGTHGGGTWKVDLSEPLRSRVGQRQAFLQRYVENGREVHRDLRAYVVDDEVVGAMYRYPPEEDWRSNVSLGGETEGATGTVSEEAKSLAREATRVIGLDYAGVDLVEGDDGWYVLELNTTAGFRGLYDATGRSVAPYIAKLAIEHVGGSVDDARVRDLATALDDSTPACKPTSTGIERRDGVAIGYTEEVVVSGTSDSETVMAKSDTGASRTSVDTDVAAAVGAGPVQSTTTVKSATAPSGKTRPVVDVVIGVGGDRHTVAASLEDRGHMEYPVLLGRDVLSHYSVNVRKRADAPADVEDPVVEE